MLWCFKSSVAVLLLSVAVVTDVCSGFRQFQALLPNGGQVPSPCAGQSTWEGVGHQAWAGGSVLNPFGEDFRRLGKTWTKSLCELDSDGDGRTNGQELGDENCTWSPGRPIAVATSHPGICEPIQSAACQKRNQWLDCTHSKPDDLALAMCEHVTSNSTFPLDIIMTATPVPAEETVYMCQLIDLDLPSGSDLHMVATQPIVRTSEVVHHILLFGCDPRVPVKPELRTPHRCAMAPDPTCRSLIGTWTLGSPGECAHPEMGFRMGVRGYRTVALQIHWNNPKRLSGLTDSSGMKIHLTSDLRPHDAGMFVVGQRFLQIEGQAGSEASHMQFEARCPSHCTQEMFQTPIYITAAVNHMHYQGSHQSIKLYRNSTVDRVITDQDNWSYDDPVIYNFKQAIVVRPGDEIRTVCTYKQKLTAQPVCWGQATSDEMCFGFLTYYPLQSLQRPWCVSMNKFPSCARHLPALSEQPFDGCRWWEFRNFSHPEMRRVTEGLLRHCYPGMDGALVCTDRCRELANSLLANPCLKGEARSYMIGKFKEAGQMGLILMDAVLTCSCGQFAYCDRKYPGGLLGSRQDQFCSSAGGFERTPSSFTIFVLVFGLLRTLWLRGHV